MTTIREVAERAGVSLTTVSHVINNTRFVSEETRERVVTAMNELNYRPNALAQSLRSGRTHTIGLILPDSSNPFFAEIGRSIEAMAFQMGYSLILCNTERDPQREKIYVDVLCKKQVDGVIFVATGDQADSLEPLLTLELPVVAVDRDLPGLGMDAVLTDNPLGGYQAARHLIELGHRRIGCIAGPSNNSPGAERIYGFRQAHLEAGLQVDDDLILRGDYHAESGRLLSLTLLQQPNPPTALFVCNDLMALGALRAASQLGCRVPEDVAIIGYDDIDLASFTTPPLTTIAQPKTEIGQRAAQLLVERISDRSLPIRREILPTWLVVRESTVQKEENDRG